MDISDVQTIIVGSHVDDYISLTFREIENDDSVSLFFEGPKLIRLFRKKALGVSRHFLSNRQTGKRVDPVAGTLASIDFKLSHCSYSNCLYIFLESPQAITPAYLYTLKQHCPDSKFALYLLNTLQEYDELHDLIEQVESYYDCVISCNRIDADNKGWFYYPDCYTPDKAFVSAKHPDIDVLFVGADKGRAKTAKELCHRLSSRGLNCKFIVLSNYRVQEDVAGYSVIDKSIPYETYLRLLARANCVVEIVANGQNYCTLRTMEAVAYRKKLLTTNALLPEEPFYNEDQMLVINGIDKDDSIDNIAAFVKSPLSSYYDADYPFSPSSLVDYVKGIVYGN